jgi:hypothetical protein
MAAQRLPEPSRPCPRHADDEAKGLRLAHASSTISFSVLPVSQGNGGARGRLPRRGHAVTTDKARKAAIRQRMEQTGEPYNVARHAAEGQRASGDSHLIGDDETRRIAEGFLAASPWLGNIQWGEVPPDIFEAYTVAGAGTGAPGTERDVQPSWSVAFADPGGEEKELNHRTVLKGLRELVYGAPPDGPDNLRLLRIRQWFTEPAAERRRLKLDGSDCSRICQQALYEHQVFSTEDDALFGKRIDWFEDQRGEQPEPED